MSQEKNKICILIPTKDRETLLKRAIDSVLNQTVQPDEIIIVNDGSSDGTKIFLEDLVENHPNIKVIHRNVNGGVNVARHDGIRISESNWIATLDDDDEFFPNAVATIREKLGSVPNDYAIILFNSTIKKDTGLVEGGFLFSGEEFYDLSYKEMMVKHRIKGDCKPVFNRIIFDQGYSFPLAVNGAESDLFYLLSRDGWGIRCYPEKTTLIYFDSTHTHLSHTAPRKNPKNLLLIHIRQLDQHSEFYKKNKKILKSKYLVMAKLAFRSNDYIKLIEYFFKFILLF